MDEWRRVERRRTREAEQELEKEILGRLQAMNAMTMRAKFGVIRKFGYAGIDGMDDVINMLEEVLERRGYDLVPCVKGRYGPALHASVTLGEEERDLSFTAVQQLRKNRQKEANLTVTGVKVYRKGCRKFVVLTVKSEEICNLRNEIGLPGTFAKFQPHVSVGVRG